MDVAKAKSKTNIVFAFLVVEIQSCKKVFETLDVVIWVKNIQHTPRKEFCRYRFLFASEWYEKVAKVMGGLLIFFFCQHSTLTHANENNTAAGIKNTYNMHQ